MKRNYLLNCHECLTAFMGLRPGDRFCSSTCRWSWQEKQPKRKAQRKQKREWDFDKRRDYSLQYLYGISQEKYEAILASQGGGCALCGKTPEEEGRNLAVDHDHKTHELFGVVCASCNLVLLGRTREPEAFRRAAAYLTKGLGLYAPVRAKPKKRRKKRNSGK